MKLTPKVAYQQIKKYSQYSYSDSWARWYCKVAPLKGERVVKTILKYKNKNAKVLDLGCGTGMTSSVLASTFKQLTACDVGEMEVAATKEILKKLKLRARVIKYDGKKLPFKANTFDVVTNIEVIEHVEDSDLLLKEIKRVLKKNGILHITTANKLWPIEPHYKLPFLSYLPYGLANKYVRITGKGQRYDDIHLPTYGQFYKEVDKYFKVEDMTLRVIKDYKYYGMDKERGSKVVMLGNFLQIVDKYNLKFINIFLLWTSLGWLFIARPRK